MLNWDYWYEDYEKEDCHDKHLGGLELALVHNLSGGVCTINDVSGKSAESFLPRVLLYPKGWSVSITMAVWWLPPKKVPQL